MPLKLSDRRRRTRRKQEDDTPKRRHDERWAQAQLYPDRPLERRATTKGVPPHA